MHCTKGLRLSIIKIYPPLNLHVLPDGQLGLLLLKNYSLIQQTLDEIAADSTGEPAAKASGLGCLMEKFEAFIGLKLSYEAFVATEQLTITLQAKDVNAHICTGAVYATQTFLKNKRDDSSFTHFFESITRDSENLTEKPTLPRKLRVPRRFEQGSGQPHEFHTPADYFRHDIMRLLMPFSFRKWTLDFVRDVFN